MANKQAALLLSIIVIPVLLSIAGIGCGTAEAVTEQPKAGLIAPIKMVLASKPAINRFTASPESIRPGEKSQLTWDVSGCNEISILPLNLISAARGSYEVSPAATTTYTITALNEEGSATMSIMVTVNTGMVVGCDPVTGRNDDIDLIWEDLCMASDYQVQIAKDPGFTLMIWDSGIYTPPDTTSPALILPPNNLFHAGYTYYVRWRVRGSATGEQIRSPWFGPETVTIMQGLPVE